MGLFGAMFDENDIFESGKYEFLYGKGYQCLNDKNIKQIEKATNYISLPKSPKKPL